MDHYYARIFVLNLPIGVYEMPEVREAIGFFNHPAYRMVFSRDTRFGQRIEQGRFPNVRRANNAVLQAHDVLYESTLFAPSSPMWESWRCPMRA